MKRKSDTFKSVHKKPKDNHQNIIKELEHEQFIQDVEDASWSGLRNRIGWRYEWAREGDDDDHYIDQSLPFNPMGFSTTDRSGMISLGNNLLTASADRGFCAARGRFGVKSGAWYFEVGVEKSDGPKNSKGPHVRIGWARREACLEAPAGYDSYSYAYRDYGGEKVHESFRTVYGAPFEAGDVIGVFIKLPNTDKQFYDAVARQAKAASKSTESVPPETPSGALFDHAFPPQSCCGAKRENFLIQYKGNYFYESHEFSPINSQPVITTEAQFALSDALQQQQQQQQQSQCLSPRKKHIPTGIGQRGNINSESDDPDYNFDIDVGDLLPEITSSQFPRIPAAEIQFFKNGEPQGVAYCDIPVPMSAALLLDESVRLLKEQVHRKALHKAEMSVYRDMPLLPIHDDGTLGYYPFVSCYKGGQATLNLGPDFKFTPPPTISDCRWRPLCERYDERQVENLVCDIIDKVCESFN